MRNSCLLFFLFLIFFASCRKDVAWSGVREIDVEGWVNENPAVFILDPEAYDYPYSDKFDEKTSRAMNDTAPRLSGRFAGLMTLRYSDECNASDLKLVMEKTSLINDISCDTLKLQLFSDEGLPLGKGQYGLYELSYELPGELKVEEGSSIAFFPIKYSVPIKGISEISLILKQIK